MAGLVPTTSFLRAAFLLYLLPAILLSMSRTGQTTKMTARVHGPTDSKDHWWRHAVIYEIYPRSFQDSNGDGIGDLNGITSRLDYLKNLGIDAVWITPFYPSPQVDFGYDISDYEAIDPQFGTMEDFDRLIDAARKHRIRVILDIVPNHTSDQQQWI